MRNVKLITLALASFLFLFFLPGDIKAQVGGVCSGVITCQQPDVCCDPPSCTSYTCTNDYNIYCEAYNDSEEQCEGSHPCTPPYEYLQGACTWNPGGGSTPTPTPVPACTCTSWVNNVCGGDGCVITKMHQTRTCTNDCDVESRCVDNVACTATPTPSPTCPPVSLPTSLSSSVSACPPPHSVSLYWTVVSGYTYTLAVWPYGASGWTYYYNITSSPQIGYGYTTPGTGTWAIGAQNYCGSWSGYSYGSFTIPTCTTTPTPTPTPTFTPTPPPGCNGVCLDDGDCAGDLVCLIGMYGGQCRNSSCLSDTDCVCPPTPTPTPTRTPTPTPTRTPTPTPTRTPTPTPTRTPTPSPTPIPRCDKICRSDEECNPVGSTPYYICYPVGFGNYCRNENCPDEIDCICWSLETPVPTPTGTSTPTPTATPVPYPSCTLVVLSNPSVPQGSTTTLTAIVVLNNADPEDIEKVDFVSGSPGIVSVNPDSDDEMAYQTILTGVSPGGPVDITSTAHLNVPTYPEIICEETTQITVTSTSPWWQVIDGDVMTNGDLESRVPVGEMFELEGTGGFPGVPAYAELTNLTGDNVSDVGWLANSRHITINNKIYNYNYFFNLVPSDVEWNTAWPNFISPHISYGYEWYKLGGDLAMNAASLGARKVVIFVDGDLTINGNITKTSGFFMAIVKGNVFVNSSVTDIQGLFSVDERFDTGAGDSPLRVLGAVSAPMAAGGGILLQRDLADNANPAEVFEYDPAAVFLYPPKLSVRGMRWKEISP